ncbi:biopolymer transporter ExbD [Stagnimonas aquatica]|uniref:Biopolymer transporter ExbD n=1 Tax=Stagnimonas aquatica TaxID=2689987 RepID=A0A3N0VK96_9GAMM|nr:biopolymer transporter ExbD [Stagnimonas aquatica]ROH93187.1 biopolymer transporter ExbD [Stagnimonas aquatica]
MRLALARRPRSRLSLIPLIDVMLVLLFFFMLATSYVQVERTRLELAAADGPGTGADQAPAVAVVLEQGLLRYQGQVRPLAEWLPQLRTLPANGELLLSPAPGVSLQVLLSAWETLRAEGVAAKLGTAAP